MRAGSAGARFEVMHAPLFWGMIARKARRLLALDYDGTLAPFRVGRMEAFPLDGIVPLLEEISRRPGCSLAVISGRPLADLRRLLLPWRGSMVGSHGFEEGFPDGRVVVRQPDEAQAKGLAEALEVARGRAPEWRLEVKVSSVALHTRGLPDEDARLVEEEVGARWEEISRRSGLRLAGFNRGLELRARGWDKGRALRELLTREPPGTFPVYIGDDLTDEDAFRAVRSSGVGIKVGDPGPPTEAIAFLPDVRAVRDFLEAWVRLPAAVKG
jgi:trehalose 6-phosphate phosphatase